MLTEELQKLQNEDQSQTMDELFQSSKEGMLLDKVKAAVNALLPQMEQRIAQSVQTILTDEIRRQIAAIQVRDGRDGKDGQTPDLEKTAKMALSLLPPVKDGKDGKAPTMEEILARIPRPVQRGGGGSTMVLDDLSSQANGVLKTFTTTRKIGTAMLVASTQFPQVFRPVIDFTGSGTTLTLTAEVGAPQSGQTLIFLYVEG